MIRKSLATRREQKLSERYPTEGVRETVNVNSSAIEDNSRDDQSTVLIKDSVEQLQQSGDGTIIIHQDATFNKPLKTSEFGDKQQQNDKILQNSNRNQPHSENIIPPQQATVVNNRKNSKESSYPTRASHTSTKYILFLLLVCCVFVMCIIGAIRVFRPETFFHPNYLPNEEIPNDALISADQSDWLYPAQNPYRESFETEQSPGYLVVTTTPQNYFKKMQLHWNGYFTQKGTHNALVPAYYSSFSHTFWKMIVWVRAIWNNFVNFWTFELRVNN